MIVTTLLQAAVAEPAQATNINILTLLAKGGWIMIPLLLLAMLTIFIMADSWYAIRKMLKIDRSWFAAFMAQVKQKDLNKAHSMTKNNGSALARIMKTGLESSHLPPQQIEEDMQMEARQILARVEAPVGYLSMIATLAPMLGFVGTIFGVINIFINISITNDLSISSISDGLYQKMVCSGVGLLVGIVAFCGYYILNRKIDKMVLLMDAAGNQLLKAIVYNNNQQMK